MKTPWTLFGPASDYVATRRLLLAGLGVVYAIAFASLRVQVLGLVGSDGILPNAALFEQLAQRTGLGFLDFPSACWWLGCSDRALLRLCDLGVLSGVLLAFGVAPLPAAGVCWFAYLSLFRAGQIFLGFQWDVLLLEAGFLALLLAPPRALLPTRAHWAAPPSRAALLLVRWLLFRLIFSSGVVKLSSGDPSWRDLSALGHHYETQPLPTWTAWYAAQAPGWAHEIATFCSLAAELLVPFLFFGPRRARLLGAAATAALMLGIALTGNYGFFNLLTAVLCLALIDDRVLPGRVRRALAATGPAARAANRGWTRALVAPIGLYLAVASLVPLASAFRASIDWRPLRTLHRIQRPFELVHRYGLFAVMTTTRPEIVLEGSADGRHWKPYAFKWKPGDPKRAPAFVEPHMPRLDWQMWFAALGSIDRNRWVVALARRLLEGSPPVLELLADDPFPDGPPRFVRAVLYDYRFSDGRTRRETGAWWERIRLGLYLEPLSRDSLRRISTPRPSSR